MAEKRASQLYGPNLNYKVFISQEPNIKKLVGVATLPPSITLSGTYIDILLHKQATRANHFGPDTANIHSGNWDIRKKVTVKHIMP